VASQAETCSVVTRRDQDAANVNAWTGVGAGVRLAVDSQSTSSS
jgi:hypothetical protein